MAWRQQIMEDSANRSRHQSETFKVGDRVWLSLKNISTPQPSKKFAWLHAKYKVVKIISPHVVELDIPSGIHPRFHVDLIKKAAVDPLPSQIQDDFQPDPVDTTAPRENQEFLIERILRAENKRGGHGSKRMLLVKWKGQKEPTWEPRCELEQTAALDDFEKKFGVKDNTGEMNVGVPSGTRNRQLNTRRRGNVTG